MKSIGFTAIAVSVMMLVSCGDKKETPSESAAADTATTKMEEAKNNNPLKPAGPKPDWAPTIHDEMLVVMEKLASLGGKPIESLSPAEARTQPTPTDAVKAVMADHAIPMPPLGCDTVTKDLGGGVTARIYTPKGSKAVLPVILYVHGGGWVIADNDVYMASAQGMCEQTGAAVVSVEYRKGPEFKFPTAHNDVFAAYVWILSTASSMSWDTKKIALVGESAGGNMACNVSIMARDKGIQMPVYQVLVYPVAQSDLNTASYQKNAAAKPLNKPMIEWFVKHYLPSPSMAKDPRMSLVAANLKNLPPTTIITAEIDPLQQDGVMLSDKLKAAGVSVKYVNYDGVTHEFFGMATVLPEAKDAQARAAGDIKLAFK